jgi:hypothetical protein
MSCPAAAEPTSSASSVPRSKAQSDLDRIFDLNFGQGDSLVFNNFGANTFFKANGVNAFNGGTSAILDSFGDIVAAAGASNLVTAKRASQSNDNLLLSITDADGQIQTISITAAGRNMSWQAERKGSDLGVQFRMTVAATMQTKVRSPDRATSLQSEYNRAIRLPDFRQ